MRHVECPGEITMSYPDQPQSGWPGPHSNQPYQQPNQPYQPQGQYPSPGQGYPPQGQYAPPGHGYPPPGQGYPPPGVQFGQVGRPGSVTSAAVVAFIMAAFDALALVLLLGLASNAGGGIVYAIAILNGIFAVVMVWGGVMALTGKSGQILGFAAIALIVVNVGSTVWVLSQGGGAATGFLGIILPAVVVALLRQQNSKDFFAANGGKSL